MEEKLNNYLKKKSVIRVNNRTVFNDSEILNRKCSTKNLN